MQQYVMAQFCAPREPSSRRSLGGYGDDFTRRLLRTGGVSEMMPCPGVTCCSRIASCKSFSVVKALPAWLAIMEAFTNCSERNAWGR